MGRIDAALNYLVGFAIAGTLLAGTVEMDPAEHVGFLAGNEALMHIWRVIIYAIDGALLVALPIAIHERLRTGAPDLARIATAFGLIWAGLVIVTGMLRLTCRGLITGRSSTVPAAAPSTSSLGVQASLPQA